MIENLITMVKMIAFSFELSRESGYQVGLRVKVGVSPREAMEILFIRKES